MSRSFTSKPGVTKTRGRGRGSQTRTVQPVNADRMAEQNREIGGVGPRIAQNQPQTQFSRDRMARQTQGQLDEQTVEELQGSDLERRMTYQGGFSMITPNQRKRQEINQVAQRETAAYEAHKQQNTPKSFNYVGTAGGGQSQMEARRKLVKENPTKTQKLLQKEQKKSYFKQKEEEEIQKKKDEQRKKALENERRIKEEEGAAEHRWDKQRKMTNEAFLRRIEKKNKGTARAQASVSAQSTQNASKSESPERLQPAGAVGTSVSAIATEKCQNFETYEDLNQEEFEPVSQLAAIFPQYSREELCEILTQVDFSIDSAIDILQD